jgi:hypothetical protein
MRQPAREWTDAELVKALRADMQRPFREVGRTHLRRRREQAEGIAEATEVATMRRARRKRKVWTEKQPGQLRSIRDRLKAGDASPLSVAARRMLVLIARRPDVVTSRRWTTAKTARVTVDTDAVRFHFHHWAASVARGAATLKARQEADLAAAEIRRQDQLAYRSLAAAQERDEREQERIFELQEAARAEAQLQARAALARLVDRSAALREDARLDALEAQELEDVPDGPWIALDDAEGRASLRVLDGGRVSE